MPFGFDQQNTSSIPGGNIAPSMLDPDMNPYTTGERIMAQEPDKYARYRDLSNRSLKPIDAIEPDPDFVDRSLQSQEIDNILQDAPVTRDWFATDPENAILGSDSVENLSAIERLGRAFERGTLTRELTKTGFAYRADRSDATRVYLEQIQAELQGLGQEDNTGFFSWLTAAAEVVGQNFATLTDPEAAASTAKGAIAGTIAGSLTGPGALLTGTTGAVAGLTYYYAKDAIEQSGGESYLALLKEGIDPDTAANVSGVVAIINGGLEMVGTAAVMKPFVAAAKTAFKAAVLKAAKDKAVIKAFSEFGKNYALGVGGEVLTEGGQELVQIAGEEVAKSLADGEFQNITPEEAFQRVKEVMIQTAKAMSVLALPGPATKMVMDKREAARTQKDMEIIDEIKKEAEGSALFKRDPEKAAKHVAEVMNANKVEYVYISPEPFFEWLTTQDNPGLVAEQLDIVEQVDDAKIFTTDIELTAEQYAKFLLLSSGYEATKDHTKTTVDGLTPAEAKEVENTDLSDLLEADHFGLMAGEDPAQQIAAYELGLQGFFKTADEAGMTPKEYEEYLVKIQRATEETRRRAADAELKKMQDINTAMLRSEKKKIEAEERESINNLPVYSAVNGIQNERLDLDKVNEILGDTKLVDLLPTQTRGRKIVGSSKKGPTIDPEIYAELHGFDSAFDMLTQMISARPYESLVSDRVRQRVATELAGIRKDRDNLLEMRKALMNDSVQEVLMTEINAMRKAKGEKALSAAVIREAAKKQLDKTKVKDVKPGKFLTAQKKLAVEAGKMLRKRTEEVQEKEEQPSPNGWDKIDSTITDPNKVIKQKLEELTSIGENTINEGLRTIASFSDDPSFRELATLLLDFFDNEEMFYIFDNVNPGEPAAAGLAGTNSFRLFRAYNGVNTKTFLHEAVHVATLKTLYDMNSPVRHKFVHLYDTTKMLFGDSRIQKELSERTGTKVDWEVLNKQAEALFYGLKNVYEFVAEAFTNKEFQNFLTKIPAYVEEAGDTLQDKNTKFARLQTVYDQFVSLVKQVITKSIPANLRQSIKYLKEVDDNVLDKVFELSDELFQDTRNRKDKDKKWSEIDAEIKKRFEELRKKTKTQNDLYNDQYYSFPEGSSERSRIAKEQNDFNDQMDREKDRITKDWTNAKKELYEQASPPIEGTTANRQKAVQLKFQQILNFEMAKQSIRMEKRIAKQTAYMKRFLTKKKMTISPEYHNAILELLKYVSFDPAITHKTPPKALKTLPFNPREPVEIDPALIKNYQNMTVAEFNQLYNKIKEIHHKGINEMKLRKKTEKKDLQYNAEILTVQIGETLGKKPRKDELLRQRSKWERTKKYVKEVGLVIFNADTILREIDGGQILGHAYNMIKAPYDLAMSKGYMPGKIGFIRRDKQVKQDLIKLFNVYTKKQRLNFKKLRTIPGMGRKITHEQMLSVLLNSGNDQNFMAMVNSGTFTHAEIEAVQEAASENDWKFAQSIWDYFDTYWEEIRETEVRRRNVEPEKVKATPVKTKYGEFKGGYYPIHYNKQESAMLTDSDVEQFYNQSRYGSYLSSHTADGHKKARTDHEKQYKLSMELYVIFQHLNQVIYDIEMGDAIADSFKALTHPDVKKAFWDSGHDHYWNALELWLRDTITQEVSASHALERGLRWLRSGLTISNLAWNVGTMLTQISGLTQTAVVIGHKNMYKGVYGFLRSPLGLSRMVNDLSPFMQSRDDTWHKDINDAQQILSNSLLNKTLPGNVPRLIRDSFFFGIKKLQRVVDLITWSGAYQRGLELAAEQGRDEQFAVDYADRQVTRSQASGIFGDRTAVERGSYSKTKGQSEFVRSFTVMASYMLAKTNIAIERTRNTSFKNPVQVVAWAWDMAILYAVDAALVMALKGNFPDEEDDLDDFIGNVVSNIFGGLFLIKEGVSAAQGFSGGGTIGNVAGAFADAYEQVSQGKADLALTKSINNLGGIFFHYPSRQLNKILHGIFDDKNEENEFVTMIMGPKFK